MKVSITIDVPDYIYLFYQKISEHNENRSVEELMASAVHVYAEFIANELQKEDTVIHTKEKSTD